MELQNQPPHLNTQLNDLTGEIWENIPGLEGYALISNFGRVKRLPDERVTSNGRIIKIEERILKQKISKQLNEFKKDYKLNRFTTLLINGTFHHIAVGRMVYYCFVQSFSLEDRSLYVTYRDGDGLNVRPDNLQLTNHTGIQQMIIQQFRKDMHFGHSQENQLKFSARSYRSTIKAVSRFDLEGKYIDTFESIAAAARVVCCSAPRISAAAKGKKGALTAGGYIWRFGENKSVNTYDSHLRTHKLSTLRFNKPSLG